MPKTILLTGSQGFVGSYLCEQLLARGYHVIGVDDYSKYGKIARPHDDHENFTLYQEDVVGIEKTRLKQYERFDEVDIIIANAAMVGGVSYCNDHAYEILQRNNDITASTFALAIDLRARSRLQRIVVISSGMVYEATDCIPTPEDDISPPPPSMYGFQKLTCEYFCKAALSQHDLPYTIIRPANVVGVGEDDMIGGDVINSGNVKLMMSHVLPDFVTKMLSGQYPLHILGSGDQVRCYTNGKDIARGIIMAMESPEAINQAFNISTSQMTTVWQLAEAVWKALDISKPLKIVHDESYKYDIMMLVPDTKKAKDVLGFEAEVSLEESIHEVIDYVKRARP